MAAATPKPLRTTFAPAPARASAMPSPIPLVEPVTMAVRPASVRWPLPISAFFEIGIFDPPPVNGAAENGQGNKIGSREAQAEMPIPYYFDERRLWAPGKAQGLPQSDV